MPVGTVPLVDSDNFSVNVSNAVDACIQALGPLGYGSDQMNRPLEGFGFNGRVPVYLVV
jgi:hypothetical protein